MYLCENRKAPGTAYRQTECTGCQQGSPKDFPALILPQRAGIYIQSSFFIKKSNLRKERGKNHEFFYNSSNRIKDSRNSNRSRRGSMGRYQPSGRLSPSSRVLHLIGYKTAHGRRRYRYCGSDGDSTAYKSVLIIHGNNH